MTARNMSEWSAEISKLQAGLAQLSGLVLATPVDYAAVIDAAKALHDRARVLLAEIRGMDVTTIATAPVDILSALRWRQEQSALLVRLGGRLLAITDAAVRARGSMLTQRRTHTVRTGDTFQSLAARYLGDWTRWPLIVEANQANPAAELPPGLVLIIPEADGRAR